jgi:N-acetyl-alpha-D-muramate 1-phosphate uridylyltransferase
MQCVILAGGLGTRMRPFTNAYPKALLPVRGRPFTYHQLHWLASQGVDDVVYSIGYRGEMIRQYWEAEPSPVASLRYVDEGNQLRGTGGALCLAREQGVLAQCFLVLYGDSFLPVPFAPIWQAFQSDHRPALMTVLHNRGRWGQSNARYQNGRVVVYDKAGGVGLDYIDYGLSALRRELFEHKGPDLFDLSDLFHELSHLGELTGYEVEQRFYEVGSPAGLRDFEEYLDREPVSAVLQHLDARAKSFIINK